MKTYMRPMATAVALACGATVQASPAPAASAALSSFDNLTLLDQSNALPEGFREHFFNVPLIVRIERDGHFLGDGRVVLSDNNTVQLIDFNDVSDSDLTPVERQRWLKVLEVPRPLGACATDCSNGLISLHYSLESSLLAIATSEGGKEHQAARYYASPETGSRGLLLGNQLNIFGGERMGTAARYALDAKGSLGNWTTMGSYQVDRGSEKGAELRQYISALYAQREYKDHFVRLGYFSPNFDGVSRQPRAPWARTYTTLGVMAGSSDTLLAENGQPSVYPVQVTANRDGTVEIYRDGALVSSQQVRSGLQQIDTRALPGGVYEVELRVIEDGQVTSRETTLIYKPNHWSNPEKRWRYSAYAGRQAALFDSFDDPDKGTVALGVVGNYLVHPRVVLGAAVQRLDARNGISSSIDWHAHDRFNLLANLYRVDGQGSGVDGQGMFTYDKGSVLFSHSRTWQESRRYDWPGDLARERELNRDPYAYRSGWLQSTAISINHRVDTVSQLTARVSHQRGVANGLGLDLAFHRRQRLFGSDANWRVSVFDRPATTSTGQRRNRGVDFTLNLSLGNSGRQYTGGMGTRTSARGGRDVYASAGVQQTYNEGTMRGLGAQVTGDRMGLSASANTTLQNAFGRVDAYGMRSSSDGLLSGGLNLASTIAIGKGRAAFTGDANISNDTGIIIDLSSDAQGASIMAHDSRGGSYPLHAGRNFVPVSAYRAGHLQLDFQGRSAPVAAIQPQVVDYHLNRGGIDFQKVHVLRTITVMGNLHDSNGEPLPGAQLRNHVGRNVSESDGFFVVEVSRANPVLEISHHAGTSCQIDLADHLAGKEDDTLTVGKLSCSMPAQLSDQQAAGAALRERKAP